MAASLPKIGGGFSDHATNFVRACQGTEESRSPFRVSGPLTQVFLLGVIAQRLGRPADVRSPRGGVPGNADGRRRCWPVRRRARGGSATTVARG